MNSFAEGRREFNAGPGRAATLPRSLVPVDGHLTHDIVIRNEAGEALEEYYKWEFFYALLNSGLYPKDYLGAEVRFPKGSRGAAPLKVDGVIFDDGDWIERYRRYWGEGRAEDLQWLNDHLIAVFEFKRGEKEIEKVFAAQIKPAMREKDPSDAYVLGVYYDAGRLFLFHRRDGKYLRYDEWKNQKGPRSQPGDLSLDLPDPYSFLPSFAQLKGRIHRPSEIDRSNRSIDDLEVITSIGTVQVRDALSSILRTLDKYGLVNQRGYEILIQTLALKISDEKRNKANPTRPLQFYITEEERGFRSLHDHAIGQFIQRIKGIREQASGPYEKILRRDTIDWQEPAHVRVVAATCENFQDFSFVRSAQSDLYQLVFYNFANKFQLQDKAQFLTPLEVIDFLVRIVNPRDGETVFDPCCGIADFLSLSYVNAQSKNPPWTLNDANIYGADIGPDMITLAALNMLLNGDGKAHLFTVPDKGSIVWKIKRSDPPDRVELNP